MFIFVFQIRKRLQTQGARHLHMKQGRPALIQFWHRFLKPTKQKRFSMFFFGTWESGLSPVHDISIVIWVSISCPLTGTSKNNLYIDHFSVIYWPYACIKFVRKVETKKCHVKEARAGRMVYIVTIFMGSHLTCTVLQKGIVPGYSLCVCEYTVWVKVECGNISKIMNQLLAQRRAYTYQGRQSIK